MKRIVDLNSDIGESFGAYKIGNDKEILQYITSANIACGYHAGDHNVIFETVKEAVKNGVALGAHPGLPDLVGFGRRKMDVTPNDVYNMVVYQVNAVQGFAQLFQHSLNHVKPHGALYNMAANDEQIASAIAKAVRDTNPSLYLFGLSGSALIKEGERIGLKTVEEVFADRTYNADGTLTPRSHPQATIEDPQKAIQQVISMVKNGTVLAVDGSEVPVQADSICVHGDGEHALIFVQHLRVALKRAGITVSYPGG
ncbi:LamB/YcsF family protein [Evansella cellulosilytica]|uniref:5-oxoprolinase subunit A n=1 Tax=Evansella cellulosilytica (strain ATCC 21833 / DSM 2522 / FERM P-1141 / JCM 9156 / N-4) TaxID=649639 RepID=E6TY73_EVAC2|nr:5-oxoprolinase subunit PxpA [Evansella cellulosilytica]ADU32392.1 LamB/YcsF family protein [Evansella cellulosilytica DSM 2522]